ncbi:MAG: PepSY-like domain-containing protein [Muribaculaceae bacterium]|nr:PepSY-like domain-containing protein [Muribaculaceae bacterium]
MKVAKFFLTILTVLPLACLLNSCTDDDDRVPVSSLPDKTETFIARYYPNTAVQSVDKLPDGAYSVNLYNSASITFDSNDVWTEVDGNGSVLGTMLLYDQLPAKLYSYLESGGYTQNVFAISRNSKQYSVTLLSTMLYYDRESGEISSNTFLPGSENG